MTARQSHAAEIIVKYASTLRGPELLDAVERHARILRALDPELAFSLQEYVERRRN